MTTSVAHSHAVRAPAEPLRSRPEAAAYLGVSVQTLAHWASTGRVALAYVRVGRLAKYKQADLDAFVARNTIGGEPE